MPWQYCRLLYHQRTKMGYQNRHAKDVPDEITVVDRHGCYNLGHMVIQVPSINKHTLFFTLAEIQLYTSSDTTKRKRYSRNFMYSFIINKKQYYKDLYLLAVKNIYDFPIKTLHFFCKERGRTEFHYVCINFHK
jgi:hypothetical protein